MAETKKVQELPKPWERQPNETSESFHAFAIYRDLGHKRSMPQVAKAMDKNPCYKGGYTRTLQHMSRKWNWVERTRAWDDYQDRMVREAAVKELEDMRRRHIQQAVALQTKALERLRSMDPHELTGTNVIQFIQEAVKIERMARGEPDTIMEERRRMSEEDAKVISKLASDPGFLGALQQALETPPGKTNPDGGAGPVDKPDNQGEALGETAADCQGDGDATQSSGS